MATQRFPAVKINIGQAAETAFIEGASDVRPLPSYYTVSFNNDPLFSLTPNTDGSYPEQTGYYDGIKIPNSAITSVENNADFELPPGTVYKMPLNEITDYLVDPSNDRMLQIIIHKRQSEHVLNQTVNRIAVWTADDVLLYLLHISPVSWGTGELFYSIRHEYQSATTLEEIAAGDIDKQVIADERIEGIAENIAKLQVLSVDHSCGSTEQVNELTCTRNISEIDTLSGKVYIAPGDHHLGSKTINDVEFSRASDGNIDLESNSVVTLNGNIKGDVCFVNDASNSILVTAHCDGLNIISSRTDSLDFQGTGYLLYNGIPYFDGTRLFANSIIEDDALHAPSNAAAFAALLLKANLDSPVFSGNPSVPNQALGNDSTSAANTAFVQATLAALVNSSPAALDTLNELAAALANDPNFAATMNDALAARMSKSENLNDVADKPTARTNLDVFSKQEVNALHKGCSNGDVALLKKIVAPVMTSGDSFGMVVANSGDRIVVGAVGDDDGGSSAGAAYIFDSNGVFISKIVAPDAQSFRSFGGSVDISDNRIVVGSHSYEGYGAAYIFDSNGVYITRISDESLVVREFGRSVAISGDRIVVGAFEDKDADQGAIFIFDSNGVFISKIVNTDSKLFGGSVDISGDRIIVGAEEDEDNGYKAGAAYIYDSDGNFISKIVASDASSSSCFGNSVAISSDRIVVGAYEEDGLMTAYNRGAAYIYDSNGNFIVKIEAPDEENSDYFGSSVGISGDRIVVGAYGGGAAYVFDSNGVFITRIAVSSGNSDKFGYSGDISGDRIIIGAWGDNDGGTSSGAAYIFYNVTNNILDIAAGWFGKD